MPTEIDLSLTAAPMFLLVLPLLLLIIRDLSGSRRNATIALTGLEYLHSKQQIAANRKRLYYPVLSFAIVIVLGLLWAGPEIQSSAPVISGDVQTQRKDLMLAIDVSRSMSGPLELLDKEARLAAYGKEASGEQRQSRYEVARETVYKFVDRFPDARIGLILFSTEPFLARWPTIETSQRFIEILEENLNEASQLRRFSSLTNTDAALRLAKDVFASRTNVSGGAVIHISDAIDELENMGIAISSLRADGIRLYTIGVGISESIVDKLSQEFSGDPGFRIFRADSEEEMGDAYRLVAELEESLQYSTEENAFVTDLRWIMALALVVFSAIVVWVLESRLHHTRVRNPDLHEL
jgi:hypothetical protein